MLLIEENPKWILVLMSFLLGVILFGRLTCQPTPQAEELTILKLVSGFKSQFILKEHKAVGQFI